MQDARAYAATGFARDILSVADNLASRARCTFRPSCATTTQLKNFVAGIEATQRELDKVFGRARHQPHRRQGLPLDPNQHQAMLEVPDRTRSSRAPSCRKCRPAT